MTFEDIKDDLKTILLKMYNSGFCNGRLLDPNNPDKYLDEYLSEALQQIENIMRGIK